ncbi:MAG: hypothetical protein ABI615_01695 [Chthoniobacterales bacterium]
MNWRRLALFQLHRCIGSDLGRAYADFIRFSLESPETIHRVHTQRLTAILQHARTSVPFYQERAAADTLTDFPILTKSDIRTNFLNLMHPSLRDEYEGRKSKSRYSWVEVKTGGSTGKPVSVIHDRAFRDQGRASRLFSQYLCGFPAGEPYFMLWGSMKDINSMKDSKEKQALNFLLQVHPLNAFQLDDAHCRTYLNQINTSPIRHMMAYVDAAAHLARFAQRERISIRPLKSIMACAGTVTDDTRTLLKEVFQCTVHNKYGSRECTDMMCETKEGNLMAFWNHIHMEIVNDQGKPVSAGETGRILITLLGNNSFPIIRYEIGDVGAMNDLSSHFLPSMKSLEGRISDFISATDGTYVSPVYIRHLIGVVHNPGYIDRFQLAQESPHNYSLKIEIQNSVSDQETEPLSAVLQKDLQRVLGSNAEIAFQRVEKIPESASGKFRYIINRQLEQKATASE